MFEELGGSTVEEKFWPWFAENAWGAGKESHGGCMSQLERDTEPWPVQLEVVQRNELDKVALA